MSATYDQLIARALELPEEDRARLAAQLLATLDPVAHGQDRTEEEWIAEVERRARAARDGSPGVPWEQVRERIEKRLTRP